MQTCGTGAYEALYVFLSASAGFILSEQKYTFL
jgi:hypothetical protein